MKKIQRKKIKNKNQSYGLEGEKKQKKKKKNRDLTRITLGRRILKTRRPPQAARGCSSRRSPTSFLLRCKMLG
jgi:hypothetical protein